MLRSRIIPCLLVQNNGLVKTVRFKEPKYVGDPINAVRIFNEKEVDELMVLDIDATAKGRTPNMAMIRDLAAECRMPLCYGGGVTSSKEVEQIVGLGVEKVAVSSAAVIRPTVISEMSNAVGRQSVVVVLDVKRNLFGKYSIFIHNGKQNTKIDPFDFAKQVQDLGAGEIVVNSIDQDGTMNGYDWALTERMRNAVDVPITIMGGAGKMEDLAKLVQTYRVIGACAGSLFVFKGKYRAVLISYPIDAEKQRILNVP
jgi:imidazole glycerol-phosphate synthase subunit HisF